MGLAKDYNGVDVEQYSDCVCVSAQAYIERLLKTHLRLGNQLLPSPLIVLTPFTMTKDPGRELLNILYWRRNMVLDIELCLES